MFFLVLCTAIPEDDLDVESLYIHNLAEQFNLYNSEVIAASLTNLNDTGVSLELKLYPEKTIQIEAIGIMEVSIKFKMTAN